MTLLKSQQMDSTKPRILLKGLSFWDRFWVLKADLKTFQQHVIVIMSMVLAIVISGQDCAMESHEIAT